MARAALRQIMERKYYFTKARGLRCVCIGVAFCVKIVPQFEVIEISADELELLMNPETAQKTQIQILNRIKTR